MRLEAKKIFLLFIAITTIRIACLWGHEIIEETYDNECTLIIRNKTQYDLNIYVRTKKEEVFQLAAGGSMSSFVVVKAFKTFEYLDDDFARVSVRVVARDLAVNKLMGDLKGEPVIFKREKQEEPLQWWPYLWYVQSVNSHIFNASQIFSISDDPQQVLEIQWTQDMAKKAIFMEITQNGNIKPTKRDIEGL